MVERTVATSGSANRERPPERAHVELEATAEGPSPASARQKATDIGATVLESLPAELGHTTGMHISKGMHLDDDEEMPFTARQTIEVNCLPDEAATVITAGTDAGAAATSVEFGLADETHERLYNEAVAEAMTDARRTAEQIASAEGATVGPVREATTVDSSGMSSLVDSALESGPGESFEFHPQPITVEAKVEVSYDLNPDSGEEIAE